MQGYLNNYLREYIHEAGGDAKAGNLYTIVDAKWQDQIAEWKAIDPEIVPWFPSGKLMEGNFYLLVNNPSPAGWESVMSLVSGNWAVAFWLLFVIVGLVLPTILECWMLWLAKHEFETSRTGQMISALSDAGVLVGGFMLRLLIVSAAVPITIVQPWML